MNIKKLLNAFLIGIGYGMLVYLLMIAAQGVETQTLFNIATVSLCSGLIGVVSLIYDVEEWPLLWKMLIHYVTVLGLIIAMNLINGFPIRLGHPFFWLIFTGIYLVIWLSVYLTNYRKIDRINRKLQDRRKEKP